MDTITIEEIQAMSDEEVAQLNTKLAKKLGKVILTRLAVGTVVAVGVHFALKKLENREEIETIDTPVIEA